MSIPTLLVQVEKDDLLMVVEKLSSQQSVALEDSLQHEEEVKSLRHDLLTLRSQLQASQDALQHLEDRREQSSASAEGRAHVLKQQIRQLQAEKDEAIRSSEKATMDLQQVCLSSSFRHETYH
jgi:predicted  nucleic acid-binding Zn-ribbon protein